MLEERKELRMGHAGLGVVHGFGMFREGNV